MGRLDHTLLDGVPLTSASSIPCLSEWSHTVHLLGIELSLTPTLGVAADASTYQDLDSPPSLPTLYRSSRTRSAPWQAGGWGEVCGGSSFSRGRQAPYPA